MKILICTMLFTGSLFGCESCSKWFNEKIQEVQAEIEQVIQYKGNDSLWVEQYYFICGIQQGLREAKDHFQSLEHGEP